MSMAGLMFYGGIALIGLGIVLFLVPAFTSAPTLPEDAADQ